MRTSVPSVSHCLLKMAKQERRINDSPQSSYEESWDEISQALNSPNWHEDSFLPLCFLWQWDILGCASWDISHLPPPSPLGIWTKILVHIQPFSSGSEFIGCSFILEFSL